MHSWRVLILPYLGWKSVYDEYDFNEPWNGPHNSRITSRMPEAFRCGFNDDRTQQTTDRLAVVGHWPDLTLWWDPADGRHDHAARMKDCHDGLGNTIQVVETTDSGIHWMEPVDLVYSKERGILNPKTNVIGISGAHSRYVYFGAMFADGQTYHLFPNIMDGADLRRLLTIQGMATLERDEMEIWGSDNFLRYIDEKRRQASEESGRRYRRRKRIRSFSRFLPAMISLVLLIDALAGWWMTGRRLRRSSSGA